MAKLEFDRSASEKYFDVIVEIGFKHSLSGKDIAKLLQTITNVLCGAIADKLFEELISLGIDQKTLHMRFRYSTAEFPSLIRRDNNLSNEDFSRLSLQFIFYLFAKIDSQYALGDIPFPSNFRYFLDLPDNLQKHYSWNLDNNS